MAKVTEWRKSCPKNVLANQISALECDNFFVVRQNGPLAFSIQELSKKKPFEIRLGDPHRCTCKWYRIAQDLCVHICWIILKKCCINVHNVISFQRGMSARELQEYVHGKTRTTNRQYEYAPRNIGRLQIRSEKMNTSMKSVRKRSSNETDSCPICLDSCATHAPVVYCKYSCGNGVHARCMTMLIRNVDRENLTTKDSTSQGPNVNMIKCPLCRGNFNTITALRLEIQRVSLKSRIIVVDSLQTHDQTCRYCNEEPIRGNLYRCLRCDQVFLCSICVSKKDFRVFHGDHDYAIKQKSDGPWKPLGRIKKHNPATKSRNPHLMPIDSSKQSTIQRNLPSTSADDFRGKYSRYRKFYSQERSNKSETHRLRNSTNSNFRNELPYEDIPSSNAGTDSLLLEAGIKKMYLGVRPK